MLRSPNSRINNYFISIIIIFSLFLFSGSCDYLRQYTDTSVGMEKEAKSVVQTEWSEKNIEKQKTEAVVNIEKQEKEAVIAIEHNPETSNQIETSNKKASGYTVQVGVFSIEKNASNFIITLINEGRQAYILENPNASNQKMKTVAFGNFESKTKAIKEAQRFTDEKNMESVVILNYAIQEIIRPKSQPKGVEKLISGPERIKRTRKKTGRFTFQIGGLFTKKNANHLLKRLQKKGYIPFIKKQLNEELNETWYKVQIGFYDSIDTAALAAEDFSFFEKIPAKATQ